MVREFLEKMFAYSSNNYERQQQLQDIGLQSESMFDILPKRKTKMEVKFILNPPEEK